MTIAQRVSALVIGLFLGYVMQRPQVCYNRAYRTLTLQGENSMFRALVLSMLLQMLGFQLLVALGLVKLNVVSGIWLAALVGGFAFGFAFVFAQGCSTTMWYRIGNGRVGSLLTLLGFAAGEVLTFNGPLGSLREALTRYRIAPIDGTAATLPNFLGISAWIVVIPIFVLGLWWLWRSRRAEGATPRIGGWRWPALGLSLGLLGTAAWYFSQGTGWDYGVGVVGASGPILRSLWLGPSVLNWGSYLLFGMPVGGFAAAIQRGEWSLKIPDLGAAARFSVSGLAMGISAAIAGGCNIGHTFTGAPTLAISSLLASGTIFLGAVLGNWVRFTQLGSSLPPISVGRGS